MNPPDFLEKVKSTEWVKYLERKRLLFVYLVFAEAEYNLLFKESGFRFENNLYTYKNEIGTMYRSKTELSASKQHFLNLVHTKYSLLESWKEKGEEYNQRADKLIQDYQKLQGFPIPASQFEVYYAEIINILLYGVSLPYLVLEGINDALEKGAPQEKYQKAIALHELLRATTKYPYLIDTGMAYFWKLALKMNNLDSTYYSLLSFLSPHEFKDVLNGKKKIDIHELEQRAMGCTVLVKEGVAEFNTSSEVLALFAPEKIKETNLIKGQTAYKGNVQGRARIVNTIEDMNSFQKGEILVSISTNPSLMPALRKCAAIVTDEGGIMCHAAVTSRELKKPCIIGTKIATKILKDGDLVEVNADKGIVRKIS